MEDALSQLRELAGPAAVARVEEMGLKELEDRERELVDSLNVLEGRQVEVAVLGENQGHEQKEKTVSEARAERAVSLADSIYNATGNSCRSVYAYERVERISEGTYGIVYKARDKRTGRIFALKQVKLDDGDEEGFPITALRETNILLSMKHENVLGVYEMVVEPYEDGIGFDVYMVMDYYEFDLRSVMNYLPEKTFTLSETKCLMKQLLSAVCYLHDNWCIHRDLKTANILYKNPGQLAVCDFGLARRYSEPLDAYTQLVVTLHYRAPELLLGSKTYSTEIDMWSVGCIMGELLIGKTLFPGEGEMDQLQKIFGILGTPTLQLWPGMGDLPNVANVRWPQKPGPSKLRKLFPRTGMISSTYLTDEGYDLLRLLLEYDPQKRISAREALDHEWFRQVPEPLERSSMPVFLKQ